MLWPAGSRRYEEKPKTHPSRTALRLRQPALLYQLWQDAVTARFGKRALQGARRGGWLGRLVG
jgi:hypothetical protein